jgi:peptidyl-prolyl cis-trans isomerase C
MAEELDRPFLVKDIQIGGYTIPISPVTLIILFISAQILFRGLFKSSTVTASHILLEGSSDDTKKKLEQYKTEINNDATKFGDYAGKYSVCPSGKSAKGSLGKFKQGAMVPPFDKAVFSPKNKVGDVIGPVQTQFGWHLILIHDRDEQRSLVVE